MAQNTDVLVTDFYKAQPVIEFMCKLLGIKDISEQQSPLTDLQRDKFTKEIKGLKIEITHRGEIRRKYRVIDVTRMSAQFQTFPLELKGFGKYQIEECTIAKYFSETYKIELLYSHLPCLQLAPGNRFIYLPLEVCKIVPGQRCTKNLTDQGEINAQQTKQPALLNQGVRDLREIQLFTGYEIDKWALVCFAPQTTVNEDTLNKFTSSLQKLKEDPSIPIFCEPYFSKYAGEHDLVEPMFRYFKSTYTELQLLIVVLDKKRIHKEVKRVGDTVLGMVTQCILAKNVNKSNHPRIINNLCLKIKDKLSGSNLVQNHQT